jgi:hypothetical protein
MVRTKTKKEMCGFGGMYGIQDTGNTSATIHHICLQLTTYTYHIKIMKRVRACSIVLLEHGFLLVYAYVFCCMVELRSTLMYVVVACSWVLYSI